MFVCTLQPGQDSRLLLRVVVAVLDDGHPAVSGLSSSYASAPTLSGSCLDRFSILHILVLNQVLNTLLNTRQTRSYSPTPPDGLCEHLILNDFSLPCESPLSVLLQRRTVCHILHTLNNMEQTVLQQCIDPQCQVVVTNHHSRLFVLYCIALISHACSLHFRAGQVIIHNVHYEAHLLATSRGRRRQKMTVDHRITPKLERKEGTYEIRCKFASHRLQLV